MPHTRESTVDLALEPIQVFSLENCEKSAPESEALWYSFISNLSHMTIDTRTLPSLSSPVDRIPTINVFDEEPIFRNIQADLSITIPLLVQDEFEQQLQRSRFSSPTLEMISNQMLTLQKEIRDNRSLAKFYSDCLRERLEAIQQQVLDSDGTRKLPDLFQDIMTEPVDIYSVQGDFELLEMISKYHDLEVDTVSKDLTGLERLIEHLDQLVPQSR